MNENEDKSKKTIFSSKLFQKIKGIKHIEIVVAVILGAVMLLIYFSTIDKKSDTSQTSSYTSLSEYASALEGKLAVTLTEIKGAGKVSVMISFLSGPEKIYATNNEQKQNSITNGSQTTSTNQTNESILLVGSNPIVVKELMPQIDGVVVISSGADDVKVKLAILKAIETLLNVPTTNIEILVGNK